MDLWTEFEGVTIDQSFALSKLLQTEGRSAFFQTRNASGEPVLIRIIECHFDEDEILARWRGVQTLGHPSFLCIDRFGQFLIEADDITAVYAVFERVDANLGDVLEQGRLSSEEAGQIGLSIASALETLHANGFVHEHVEARNIYAVGEAVKLRSDCIRETKEGEAGLAARRRDVHDLAVVLMQVLLGNPRAVDMPRGGMLIARFDEIVRKGMSGEWGLKEIQAALSPYKRTNGTAKSTQTKAATPQSAAPKPLATSAAAAPVSKPATVQAEAKVVPAAGGLGSDKSAEAQPKAVPELKAPSQPKAEPRFQPRPEPWADPISSRRRDVEERKPFPGPDGATFDWKAWVNGLQHEPRKLAIGGVLVLVVLLLGWMLVHRSGHSASAGSTAATPAAGAAPFTAAVQDRPGAQAHPAARPVAATTASSDSRKPWRVVAFTYNRQDQAQKKASSLSQKHADLRPEVFSAKGRAPWLVTIGGAMDRDEAYALARKARALGLPRDTYAQNYPAR
ncbi:SPOR domain-containing protein [Occallatibacter riparius]|uniref:SPOR domain-containing protein n=1 Tax=Occallatibacter riparius TaxID=1002689 RepID=A0A9J7BI28_9BACT|nr:SPOR domain-containing protein [Occallatibacter riparius]UWZ82367.1 SPOR domain-containing protein [Occallatibacter riparius]